MNFNHKKSGFTLLEIIIVIIIIGVLASLALPRLFKTVEFSRAAEAFRAMSSIRQSVERCYLQSGGTYVGCFLNNLDLEDPGTSVNSHFTYSLSNTSRAGYTIVARRNTRDGGNNASTISLIQTSSAVQRSGTTKFTGIK